jgi:hypothetical protein
MKNQLLKISGILLKLSFFMFLLSLHTIAQSDWRDCFNIDIPKLQNAPHIDGDLSDWKNLSYTDGLWDFSRLLHTPWFSPANNWLTNHGKVNPAEDDLSARYFIAWDDDYLYLGAEVHDNINDVKSPKLEPKQWFFRDAVCWFIEAPRHGKAKNFGQGDNAFCFVADTLKPDYGAWWRHGDVQRTYIEEPLPANAVSYSIRMNPWGKSKADFIFEARVLMAATLSKSDPEWHSPKEGDEYGLEIVHTDPDGGGYGGHFVLFGGGDDDSTWGKMKLVGTIRQNVK